MSPPAETSTAAELVVVDTVGRMMQFWGFKRSMGRIWTLLYLSPEPLGAADIGEALKMSAGSVSMTLAELLKWGAIKKTWRPGERRDYYEAETSIWKLVRRVLRERELGFVQDFSEALERAREALETARERGEADGTRVDFKLARIVQLLELSRVGEKLLSALVAGEAVDPTPILKAQTP